MDKKFDDLLNQHHVPQPASNLAQRICDAATLEEVKSTSWFDNFLFELNRLFVIPRPAYAIATCLIFGALIGLQLDMSAMSAGSDVTFLEIDFYEGEWL